LPDGIGLWTIDAMSEVDSQPATEALEPPALADQLQVTQFGIIHLMLWTTVTAVLLKVFMALTGESLRLFPSEQAWVFKVMQVVQVITLSSMIVGSGVLVRLRCYTMPKRFQPGHWLVLISTFELIIGLAASLLYWLVGVMGVQMGGVGRVLMFLVFVLTAAAYPCAFFQLRDARRWKVLIGAKAIGAVTAVATGLVSLVATLFNCSSPFASTMSAEIVWYCSTSWSVAVFAALLSAAALDLYRRTARDWVHWLGVVAHGLTFIFMVAATVYFVFFFHVPP
jgi:hypothetical protein